ncbi:hypothetical protein [Cellulophaga sp. Hel_I_12]|uniref:hypothetical protein n=1 Tax=Cellulophaga sp. Hel_I_12 TaxID=1249972 RepID=UPI000647DF88|nr:hypothetical protein [Cellulophaga sp. Hel_I_12]
MKKIQFLAAFLFAGLLLTSCDDDENPIAINEEEVITTLTATLTPVGGGTTITLQTRDLDGEGPNDPVVTVSGNLMAGAVYNGTLVLLNETLNPAENITDEVEEESNEHQFFFTIGGLDATAVSANNDSDGNPLGTMFTLTAGAASTGTLTFTLRHEPKKPNTGLADAGGETDVSATFNVTIE